MWFVVCFMRLQLTSKHFQFDGCGAKDHQFIDIKLGVFSVLTSLSTSMYSMYSSS